MGRDHTIYATQAGYVRYYLDPERTRTADTSALFSRRRGSSPPAECAHQAEVEPVLVPCASSPLLASLIWWLPLMRMVLRSQCPGCGCRSGPQLRPGYMYRDANWQIGRAAEKAGITAHATIVNNRWLAWRKRQARAERVAQMKSLKGKKKARKK